MDICCEDANKYRTTEDYGKSRWSERSRVEPGRDVKSRKFPRYRRQQSSQPIGL